MPRHLALFLLLSGLSALALAACGQTEDPAHCDQLRTGGWRDEECGERSGCAVDGCRGCEFCYTDVVCPDPALGGGCTCTGDRACHDLCATDADCPGGQTCQTVDLYYGTYPSNTQVSFCQ